MGSFSQPFDLIRSDIAQLKSTTALHEASYPHVSPTGGAADVYGAYVQVTAGLAYAVELYGATIVHGTTGSPTFAVDIAKGAAAAEVPAVTLVGMNLGTIQPGAAPFYVLPTPIAVAAGTRLAVRAKDTIGGLSHRVVLHWRKVS